MWLKSKFRHCCLIMNKTVLNPSCFWNITNITEKLLPLCRLEFQDCQNNTNIQYLTPVSNFSLWLCYHLLMLDFFHVLDSIGSRRINMLSVYVFLCELAASILESQSMRGNYSSGVPTAFSLFYTKCCITGCLRRWCQGRLMVLPLLQEKPKETTLREK